MHFLSNFIVGREEDILSAEQGGDDADTPRVADEEEEHTEIAAQIKSADVKKERERFARF